MPSPPPSPAQVALELSKQVLDQARQQAQAEQPVAWARQSPVDAAAQSLLNKASKIKVAQDALLTQDLQALLKADREKVRRYEDKAVFGGQTAATPTGDDVGDLIICDDYNASQNTGAEKSKLSPVLLALGALLAGGAVTAAVLLATDKKPSPTTPPAATPAATHPAVARNEYDAVMEQQQADGSWREIGRERLKP